MCSLGREEPRAGMVKRRPGVWLQSQLLQPALEGLWSLKSLSCPSFTPRNQPATMSPVLLLVVAECERFQFKTQEWLYTQQAEMEEQGLYSASLTLRTVLTGPRGSLEDRPLRGNLERYHSWRCSGGVSPSPGCTLASPKALKCRSCLDVTQTRDWLFQTVMPYGYTILNALIAPGFFQTPVPWMPPVIYLCGQGWELVQHFEAT